MKKVTKRSGNKLLPPDSIENLSGERFGKWEVLGYAGNVVYMTMGVKRSRHSWLCRCECGVEKNVIQGNLLSKLSTQCQRCAWNRHGIERTKLYLVWQRLKQRKTLSKEWQDYKAFRKAVGEPPDDKAQLRKYDRSKPHGLGNSFWTTDKSVPLVQQIRRKLKEESILQNKRLMKIRSAKTKDEMQDYMIAARKAGYSYQIIGIAAGVTRQWVHQLIAKSTK